MIVFWIMEASDGAWSGSGSDWSVGGGAPGSWKVWRGAGGGLKDGRDGRGLSFWPPRQRNKSLKLQNQDTRFLSLTAADPRVRACASAPGDRRAAVAA